MSIKFKLTRWEFFIALILMQLTITSTIVTVLICFGLVTYASSNFAISAYKNEGDMLLSLFIFFVLEFSTIFIVLVVSLILTVFSAFSAKNKTVVSEQSLVFNDDMVISTSEYGRSEIYWKTFQRVVSIGGYCFLFVSQMGASIIPKRAFSSDQEWKEFISLCRSKIQK